MASPPIDYDPDAGSPGAASVVATARKSPPPPPKKPVKRSRPISYDPDAGTPGTASVTSRAGRSLTARRTPRLAPPPPQRQASPSSGDVRAFDRDESDYQNAGVKAYYNYKVRNAPDPEADRVFAYEKANGLNIPEPGSPEDALLTAATAQNTVAIPQWKNFSDLEKPGGIPPPKLVSTKKYMRPVNAALDRATGAMEREREGDNFGTPPDMAQAEAEGQGDTKGFASVATGIKNVRRPLKAGGLGAAALSFKRGIAPTVGGVLLGSRSGNPVASLALGVAGSIGGTALEAKVREGDPLYKAEVQAAEEARAAHPWESTIGEALPQLAFSGNPIDKLKALRNIGSLALRSARGTGAGVMAKELAKTTAREIGVGAGVGAGTDLGLQVGESAIQGDGVKVDAGRVLRQGVVGGVLSGGHTALGKKIHDSPALKGRMGFSRPKTEADYGIEGTLAPLPPITPKKAPLAPVQAEKTAPAPVDHRAAQIKILRDALGTAAAPPQEPVAPPTPEVVAPTVTAPKPATVGTPSDPVANLEARLAPLLKKRPPQMKNAKVLDAHSADIMALREEAVAQYHLLNAQPPSPKTSAQLSRVRDTIAKLNTQVEAIQTRRTALAPESVEPTPTAQPVGSPHITDPASINASTWYHGSNTEIPHDRADPLYGDPSKLLMGQGFYVTNDESVAGGYANNRSKSEGSPTTNKYKVNVDKVIDADSPATPDVVDFFQRKIDDYKLHQSERGEDTYTEAVDKALAKKGVTFKELLDAMRADDADESHALSIPSSEYVETYQELVVDLKKLGYDAIVHKGGIRAHGKEHTAMILLDPNDGYAETGRKNIGPHEEAPPITAEPAAPIPSGRSTETTNAATTYQDAIVKTAAIVARKLAKAHGNEHLFDDYEGEALKSGVIAAGKFDPSGKASIETWLTRNMTGDLQKYRDTLGATKVPGQIQDLVPAYVRAITELGGGASHEDIAAHMEGQGLAGTRGITPEKVMQVEDAWLSAKSGEMPEVDSALPTTRSAEEEALASPRIDEDYTAQNAADDLDGWWTRNSQSESPDRAELQDIAGRALAAGHLEIAPDGSFTGDPDVASSMTAIKEHLAGEGARAGSQLSPLRTARPVSGSDSPIAPAQTPPTDPLASFLGDPAGDLGQLPSKGTLPVTEAPLAPGPNSDPKAMFDVMRGLMQAFNARLVSKKPGPNSGGAYYKATNEAALNPRSGALGAVHEGMHSLDETLGLTPQIKDAATQIPALQAEIDLLSQYGSDPPKGTGTLPETKEANRRYRVAEALSVWKEAYLINPEETMQKFPVLTDQLHTLIGQDHPIWPVLDAASEWQRNDLWHRRQVEQGGPQAGPSASAISNPMEVAEPPSRGTLKDRIVTAGGDLRDIFEPLLVNSLDRTRRFLRDYAAPTSPRADPMIRLMMERNLEGVIKDVPIHGMTVPLLDRVSATVGPISHLPYIVTDAGKGFQGIPEGGSGVRGIGKGPEGLMAVAERWAVNKRIIADDQRYRDQYNEGMEADDAAFRKQIGIGENDPIPANWNDAYEEYMMAATAKRDEQYQKMARNITGKSAGLTVTDGEVAKLDNENLGKYLSPAHIAAIEEYSQGLHDSFDSLVDLRVADGRFSPEEAARIKGGREFYVAMEKRGILDQTGSRGSSKRGEATVGGVKGMRGGMAGGYEDPFVALTQRMVQEVKAVYANQTRRALKDSIFNPDGSAKNPDVLDHVRLIQFDENASPTGKLGYSQVEAGARVKNGIPIYKDGKVISQVVPDDGVIAGFENGKLFLLDMRGLDERGMPITTDYDSKLSWLFNSGDLYSTFRYGADPKKSLGSVYESLGGIRNPDLAEALRNTHAALISIIPRMTVKTPKFATMQLFQDAGTRWATPGGKRPGFFQAHAESLAYTVKGTEWMSPESRAAAKTMGLIHNEGLTYGLDRSTRGEKLGKRLLGEALNPDRKPTLKQRIDNAPLPKKYSQLTENALDGAKMTEFGTKYDQYIKDGRTPEDAQALAYQDALKLHNSLEAGNLLQWLGSEVAPFTAGHADGTVRKWKAMFYGLNEGRGLSPAKAVASMAGGFTKGGGRILMASAVIQAMNYIYNKLTGNTKRYYSLSPQARAQQLHVILPNGFVAKGPYYAYNLTTPNMIIDHFIEQADGGGETPLSGDLGQLGKDAYQEEAMGGIHSMGLLSTGLELQSNQNYMGEPISYNSEMDKDLAIEKSRALPPFKAAARSGLVPMSPEGQQYLASTLGGGLGRSIIRTATDLGRGRKVDAANDVADALQFPLMKQTPNNSVTKRSLMREAKKLGDNNGMTKKVFGTSGTLDKASYEGAEGPRRAMLKAVRLPQLKKAAGETIKAKRRAGL